MGFVKTPEEVKRIEAVLKRPRFVGAEMLMIEFLTRPEIVAEVLPPGLEPVAEPSVTAMVGRWRSNCVADFAGGAIYVMARHGEIEAPYVLAMFMDQDHAIIFGRDLFGEPKKQATTRLQRRGNAMHGYVERFGTRVIEIEADAAGRARARPREGRQLQHQGAAVLHRHWSRGRPRPHAGRVRQPPDRAAGGNRHARTPLDRARSAGRHRGLRGARRLLYRGRPALDLPTTGPAAGR